MRQLALNQLKRIVIKVGTSSIIHPDGAINFRQLERLAYVISELKHRHIEVILVSSGAIGVGLSVLQLKQRPQAIPDQQAIAAIGQSELMSLYIRFFSHYHQHVGQILITRDVIDFPQSRQNVENAFQALLKLGVIPIINENDSTAVDELDHLTKFGDNDQLSAIVAEIVEADLLVMFSDVDGFYDQNPEHCPNAKRFSHLSEINEATMALAGGSGSRFGTGGMATKLKAAQRLLANGRMMVLLSSHDFTRLFPLLEGEDIGTLFAPL